MAMSLYSYQTWYTSLNSSCMSSPQLVCWARLQTALAVQARQRPGRCERARCTAQEHPRSKGVATPAGTSS